MYSEELESIIDAALADGVLTDKEREVLHKRAQAEGVDINELDVVIDGRLAKAKKHEDWLRPAPSANEKFGNVVKCPSCGAQIIGGKAVCPECGYAFSNVKVSSSVEKLTEKLEEFNKQGRGKVQAKMDIIQNFPVPNTRADLIEFLSMIQPRINSNGPKNGESFELEEDLSYAYWILYCNCINKARLSFANDNDFILYFDKYDAEFSKTKKLIGFIKSHSTISILIGFTLLVMLCNALGLVWTLTDMLNWLFKYTGL